MNPGDLVRMTDIGVRSGRIGLIVGIHRFNIAKEFMLYDVLLDGDILDSIDSSFLLPLGHVDDDQQ